MLISNPAGGHIQRLKERANQLYGRISGYEHVSKKPQQGVYQEAFESLELSHSNDPAAIALEKSLKPLKTWAGTNPERLNTLYSTALRVAAQAIGGVPGAALDGVEDYTLLSATSSLGREAGSAARPFLENVVPEAWVEGRGTGEQWRVGQTLNMIRQGRPDNIHYVTSTWLTHRTGEKLSAAEVDATVKQIQGFEAQKKAEGWQVPIPFSHIVGEKITFLTANGSQLETKQGEVESVRGAIFRLKGQGQEFNSNYCLGMMQAESEKQQRFAALDPQQKMLVAMGLMDF